MTVARPSFVARGKSSARFAPFPISYRLLTMRRIQALRLKVTNQILSGHLYQRKEAGEGLPERPVTREAIGEAREDVEFMRAKANLRASLLRRLGELTACLEVEQDLDRLKKQLDCIEGLLRAFRSMQG